MSRYTGPKNRIARRFGANIFGRLRNPLLHKPHPPGMHGMKRKKISEFGLQLAEKQKLRAVYGMLADKQLLKYFKEALRREGNTPHTIIELLESRLDNLVYRMGFATSIFHAQQLVSHGHILVNGKKIDIRSYSVAAGSTIAVKEKSKNNVLIKQAVGMTHRDIPEYLSVDKDKMVGQVVSAPHWDQVALPLPINVALVCEFLAHSH
ncbi:MAG: 30S ribosomal protein S4 [Simkaniaceae bacterium]|nr:30S ribosomal protein S4 [Simkaniaceae bacterium]